jgi:hypothetical protein
LIAIHDESITTSMAMTVGDYCCTL